MINLETLNMIDAVLKLAKKAPELVQDKIFITPTLARQLGVVDCQTCADEGQITTGAKLWVALIAMPNEITK